MAGTDLVHEAMHLTTAHPPMAPPRPTQPDPRFDPSPTLSSNGDVPSSRETSPHPKEAAAIHMGKRREGLKAGSSLSQWWKELVAALLSIGFLVAIFIVLMRIDNTPLEQWDFIFGIQPATLIAILVSLGKLFMLAAVTEAVSQLKWVYFGQKRHRLNDIETFDSASRGALGATLMLFKIRWKAIVASCGALLIVLALAMEPFAQQALTVYNKPLVTTSVTASLTHAVNYDWNTQLQVEPYADETNSINRKAYGPMLGAILEGLYNPRSTVNFQCGTSNCTWPQFTTLGVCSSCNDVSSSLETHCTYGYTYPGSTGPSACNYTFPSDNVLEATCEQNGGGSQSTLWNSTTAPASTVPVIAEISAISFSADVLGFENCYFNSSFRMPAPVATDCSLSWCAKDIEARVINGVLTETVIAEHELIFPINTCGDSTEGPMPWTMSKYPFTNWNEPAPPDVELYAAFLPGDVPRNICTSWNHSSAFWINEDDSSNILNLLYMVFGAPYTSAYTGDSVFGELFYTSNFGNLTQDIEAMATTMTNQVRMGPNSTVLTGSPLVTKTFIGVRWLWLIYPAALTFIAMGFLITAMGRSVHQSRVVWKSSSLALLFHGLHDETVDQSEQSFLKASSMKKMAKKTYVKLEGTEFGRLKLVTS